MASYGSTPLFHIAGITPEAQTIADCGGDKCASEALTANDISELGGSFSGTGDKLDVVVFAAPQLSIVEMQQLAGLCRGVRFKVPVIVCTAPQVIGDARRMGFIDLIETAGGTVLEGTCFYNQYAREIGEANGWVRLLSNSAKIVNILGGYGYKPALASMENCVASAIEGIIQ
jgi:predicted aconitase